MAARLEPKPAPPALVERSRGWIVREKEQGERIRDVHAGPEGAVYLLTDAPWVGCCPGAVSGRQSPLRRASTYQ